MKPTVEETVIFGMLGAMMYASKLILEVLPNIHLLGMFITAVTVVYGAKALFPIYVYVFIDGLMHGFSVWWLPYLYVWTVLWGAVMLIPHGKIPKRAKPFVYMAVSALHGFLFGTLYAPAQALLFGLDLKGTVAWIAAGLPFDIIHGISNLITGTLICPIVSLLEKFSSESRA